MCVRAGRACRYPRYGTAIDPGDAIMRRMWTTAVVLVLAVLSVSITHGEGWLKTKWRGFVRDTQRNNAWPEAFVPADRARVRDPFAIQTANGWRHQNTLGDQH